MEEDQDDVGHHALVGQDRGRNHRSGDHRCCGAVLLLNVLTKEH